MKYYDVHVTYDESKDGAGYSIFVEANVNNEDVTYFYKHCGMAVYDLCEITGDIEDNLQEVKKLLNTVGIEVDFEITFSGDYNGKYIVNDDGEFEILSMEDAAIRDADTDDLVKELQKRGYSVIKAGDKNGTENNGNLS